MKTKRILIVDDEEGLVAVLKKHFESIGYEILVAYDGNTALEVAFAEVPDLILLDVSLPKTDGYIICKTLKNSKKCKNVPIIMLTGRAHDEEKKLGLSYGADDYMLKPFKFEELIARIQQLIK